MHKQIESTAFALIPPFYCIKIRGGETFESSRHPGVLAAISPQIHKHLYHLYAGCQPCGIKPPAIVTNKDTIAHPRISYAEPLVLFASVTCSFLSIVTGLPAFTNYQQRNFLLAVFLTSPAHSRH